MISKNKTVGKRLHSNYKLRDEPTSSNSSKSKEVKIKPDDHDADSEPEEDIGIVLPDLQLLDKDRQLPCFSSVLKRSKEELIALEDLDRLQCELETMLSSVVVRIRSFHTEVELITVAEENKPKKTANLPVAKAKSKKLFGSSPESHSDAFHDTTDAYDDEEMEDIQESKNSDVLERTGPKRTLPLVPPATSPVPKHDVPNKLWAYIEPYLAPISPDNIKFLEQLLSSYNQYKEGEFAIPPLGEHYSIRLSEGDQKGTSSTASGSRNVASKKTTLIKDDPDYVPQDPLSMCKTHIPGPMAQRLVSALVELPSTSGGSKRAKRSDESYDEGSDEDSDDVDAFGNKKFKNDFTGFVSNNVKCNEVEQNYRNLPLYHTSLCFEKKVRKELKNFGFLDSSDDEYDSDEVLSELKQCEKELNKVSLQNKKTLENLLQLSKKELKRQTIKTELEAVNSEIINYTHDDRGKQDSAAQKKRVLSKKETECAWKLLKQREKLLHQLAA